MAVSGWRIDLDPLHVTSQTSALLPVGHVGGPGGGQASMVNFCAIVGCGKRSNRDKGTSFFRIPTEISHQGKRTHELTKKRRLLWLARIHRADLKPASYTRVCSNHFVTGIILSLIMPILLLYQASHRCCMMRLILIGRLHLIWVGHQNLNLPH